MFCRLARCAFAITILLAAVLTGCARQKPDLNERLAVIPFENLSSDLSLDWMRRAVALVVVNDLRGSPNLFAQAAESINAAYEMQASRVLQGYFYRRNGRLEIHAAIEDLKKTKTIENVDVAGFLAQGALPLANELARKVSDGARPFETAHEATLEAYGKALAAGDRQEMLQGLQAAAESDSKFAQGYLDWSRILLASGDRAGALQAIDAGLKGQPDAIGRAQLTYTAASIRGDQAARKSALESLTHLTPADARIFRELAQLQVASREFSAAIRNFEAAGRLVPDEAQNWNELGYARAYAGDLEGAKQALNQYQPLLPQQNVNGLDSLGEVSFYLGDFAGAERSFLDADRKNRGEFGGGELVKAAQARLMAGDLGNADALFRKYTQLFQGDQRGRAAFLLTQWEFMTGRRKAAMAGIEKIASSLDPDSRSQAWSQLSIWKMQTGDEKAALDLANRASGAALSPRAMNLSAVCRLISKPPAQASGSPLADALALLFARKFADATPPLERLYRETNPSADGQVRTLLAWAYVKTNRTADAAGLLNRYPLPLNSGEPMFASLIFPRYLFLRATVLEGQGKRAQAKSAYELYLKYAGDVPDAFGDDVVARKKLTAL